MSRTTNNEVWGPNDQHVEEREKSHTHWKLLGWFLAAMYAHGIVDPTGANPVFWSVQVVVMGWLLRMFVKGVREGRIPIHWLLDTAEWLWEKLTILFIEIAPMALVERIARKQARSRRKEKSEPTPSEVRAKVRAYSLRHGGGAYLGTEPDGKWVTADRESAVMVLGPPRSGKTSAVIIPALLAAPGAAISTSTKPDVMAATMRARAELGQVWLFDPAGEQTQTDVGVRRLRWSPVAGAATWDQALVIARAMTAATKPGAGTINETHWTERAAALLAPMLYAAHLTERPIEEVLRWTLRQELAPALPHVLRLPDTQLLISAEDTASATFELSVTQHGAVDPQLTGWARSNYMDTLETFINSAELGATETTIGQLAEIADHGQWQTIEPHPGLLREQITQATENAQHRLALAAPDLRHIPAWLAETLTDAGERDIQIVLCPARPELVPKRAAFNFTTTAAAAHTHMLAVLADDAHAVLHSDPAACLDRPATPARQHMHASRDREAIAWLRNRLALKPLAPRPPRRALTPTTIASLLRQALDELRGELPAGVKATIQPEDERFALQTLERYDATETPTRATRKAAAGIAWERALIARVAHLCVEHDHLQVLAERWLPDNARIDLDLIVSDDTKQVTWIIDAKNSDPTTDQLAKMLAQIRLLQSAPKLHGGRPIVGVIVHRRAQLQASPQPTEHHNILRATLQRLPDLLLAKRLPGERPRVATAALDKNGWQRSSRPEGARR